MKTPILGSSYVARSVNAADNRMVNLFPEVIPEGGKEPAFLSRAPGLALLVSFSGGAIRGMHVIGNYLYVASGDKLWRFDSTYSGTLLGTIHNAANEPVSMADNGTQLFIACNGPSFIYNTVTTVFAQIIDPDFTGAVTVGYLDGFFVYNEPNSQKIWVTALLDGTSVDPLDFASAEKSPDKVKGIIVDRGELWVFGENTTEVWYNAGNAGFPFAPIQGAFNEVGCTSAYAIAKMDNTVYWLSSDTRGFGQVFRAKGYVGERISTHAVEWQIQQYGDISDAIAYTYQQDGHSFYVLIFPNQATSWVYDAATGAWHERAGWDGTNFTRQRGNCQAFFNGKTIVGDYAASQICSLETDVTPSNVVALNYQPVKWLRSWRALPPGQNNLKRSAHHSLQLDCETGVGMVDAPGVLPGQVNPTVSLRWSDDGGHTWSNPRTAALGANGQTGTRVIWRRLGMTTKLRDRVYEISGTDQVRINITGAELIASPTNA